MLDGIDPEVLDEAEHAARHVSRLMALLDESDAVLTFGP